MQQWYQQYQAAQAHTYNTPAPQDNTAADYNKEHTQVTPNDCVISSLIFYKTLSYTHTDKTVGTPRLMKEKTTMVTEKT